MKKLDKKKGKQLECLNHRTAEKTEAAYSSSLVVFKFNSSK